MVWLIRGINVDDLDGTQSVLWKRVLTAGVSRCTLQSVTSGLSTLMDVLLLTNDRMSLGVVHAVARMLYCLMRRLL